MEQPVLPSGWKGVASGVGSAIRVLNFGTVRAYRTAVLPLTITNFEVPGTVTIGTAISGNSFRILTTAANTCLVGISAGQSCTLPVEYLANSVGDHNEDLTLTPSGGAAPSRVSLHAVEAQSVTFAGGQTILAGGVSNVFGGVPVNGVAVDSTGNVFIADIVINSVVELPKTSTGYGAQTTLPFSGLNNPAGVAVDSEGDVFIADQGNSRGVELLKTATGYGAQTTLPASGLNGPAGSCAGQRRGCVHRRHN